MKYIKARMEKMRWVGKEFPTDVDRSYNQGVADVSFIRCLNHRTAVEMINENAEGDECGVCAHIIGWENGKKTVLYRLEQLPKNWRARHDSIAGDFENTDENSMAWAQGLRQAAIELENLLSGENTQKSLDVAKVPETILEIDEEGRVHEKAEDEEIVKSRMVSEKDE